MQEGEVPVKHLSPPQFREILKYSTKHGYMSILVNGMSITYHRNAKSEHYQQILKSNNQRKVRNSDHG